jgi:hypothetical protein
MTQSYIVDISVREGGEEEYWKEKINTFQTNNDYKNVQKLMFRNKLVQARLLIQN